MDTRRLPITRVCALAVAAAALLLPVARDAHALPPSPSTCYAVVTIATVCSLGSCTSTSYVDDYWCSRTPQTDIVQDPWYRNPADAQNQNLLIDDHRDVLRTTNPCAWQFDNNDRLGSDHGGPNTTRRNHTGVDIQANRGDDVATVRHGRITAVGWQNPNNHAQGCGYRIIVSHFNGDESVYCHLVANSARFAVGDYVRAGAVIGDANSTGNSTNNHLHLSYFQNGNRIEYWNVTGTQPTAAQLNGGC